MNRFLKFFVSWLLPNLFWILPGSVLVYYVFVGYPHLWHLIFLSTLLVVGALAGVIYKRWMREKNDIYIVRKDMGAHAIATIKFFKVEVEVWEIIHWILVVGFLVLTLFATLNGLDLLFVGGKTPFIWTFSIFVTLTLLFLSIMIAKGKHFVGYCIFYVLFDLVTAFSYNFIHFYDNISATQNMDRDVRACEMYISQQRPIISRVGETIINDTITLSRTIADKQVGIDDGKKKDKEDFELAKQCSSDSNIMKTNFLEIMVHNLKVSKHERDVEKKDLDKSRDSLTALRRVCPIVEGMRTAQVSIDSLCNKYKEDKEGFELIDLTRLKNVISDLDQKIEYLNRDSVCIKQGYTFNNDNDTIEWARARLLKIRDDRFASINKLMSAAQQLVSSDNNTSSPITTKEPVDENNIFIKDDKEFDNRLILLSIMQSATIDLLPMLLCVFVTWVKRKED